VLRNEVFQDRLFSHRSPNVTAIDGRDGSVVGTMDLGGAPEQGASDGKGKLYVDLEDKDAVAVVDVFALKVTGRYELGGKGGGPAGLALDEKNHILFACCRDPHTAVVINADDGKILDALPIGSGCDGALFNPNTMEAFSSQRDGTLTVIKEAGRGHFDVEQTLGTRVGAKTSTLDAKTGRIFLITAEFAPPAPQPAGGAAGSGAEAGRGRRRGAMVPDSFTILAVGR